MRSRLRFWTLLGIVFVFFPALLSAQSSGEEIFQMRCAACHSIGGGRLVGPDLEGIAESRSESWIIKFVQSSQSLISQGDEQAKAVFEEFNKMLMPDQPLSEAEVKSVLNYIAAQQPGATAKAAPQKKKAEKEEPLPKLTEEDIQRGADLFQGVVRLQNGGPSCISCHDIQNDAVIGGGILAKELTDVFSNLGHAGVRSILGSPPFAVMNKAYQNSPLTDDEITVLVGFLEQSDRKKLYSQPRDYGFRLAMTGFVGVAFLWGLYALIWFRRKKGSVNQDIYDRQIKSQ